MRLSRAACLSLAAALAPLVAAGGCGSYYWVTDPATDSVYYTDHVHKPGSGSIRFRDAATGDDITLQNSRVTKVTKEVYQSQRYAKRDTATAG